MNQSGDGHREELTEDISGCLRAAGAELIGFAEPSHFARHGGGHVPETILAGVRTVVVVGCRVVDPVLDAWIEYKPWQRPRSFLDEFLHGVIRTGCAYLEREGFKADPVSYQPGLLLKNAAAIAGLETSSVATISSFPLSEGPG